MPNRREVTDRVLDIIATESYVNDEQLGLLLLKERDLEQALRVLAFLIMRSNETEAFVDPNLFSVCVKNTTMKQEAFASLVQYMNENQVPVTTDFLLNAFTAMVTDRNNVNTLLDIVFYLSQEDGQLPGTIWRQLMRRINGDIEEKLRMQPHSQQSPEFGHESVPIPFGRGGGVETSSLGLRKRLQSRALRSGSSCHRKGSARGCIPI